MKCFIYHGSSRTYLCSGQVLRSKVQVKGQSPKSRSKDKVQRSKDRGQRAEVNGQGTKVKGQRAKGKIQSTKKIWAPPPTTLRKFFGSPPPTLRKFFGSPPHRHLENFWKWNVYILYQIRHAYFKIATICSENMLYLL